MEEYLIEKVRLHDVLYNVRSSNYRDNNARQEAWDEIGSDMNMTAEAVKGIWERLRRCYLNALNRRRSKLGEESVPKSAWKFEIQMSFLVPFLNSRKSQGNIKDDENSIDEDIHTYDEEKHNEIEEKPNVSAMVTENIAPKDGKDPLHLQRARKRKTTERNLMQKMNKMMRENAFLRKNKIEEKDFGTSFADMDESDMFFMSMSKITKMLPLAEQAKIKLQLSNAVLSAQIKMEENQQKHGV